MQRVAEKHIFLDTMLYLHFNPIEDIDWLTLVESDSVVIVIPRITVQELDKHKDSHASRKVKNRARKILSKLDTWDKESDGAFLKDKVRVKYIPFLPRVDMAALNLSSSSNDDILVASVFEYREKTASDVLLISADSTPRLTARALGIETLNPPDALKLPDERSPIEVENATLRQTIQKLTDALPVLKARFIGAGVDSSQCLNIDIPEPNKYSEEKVQQKTEWLRKRYPYYLLTRPDSANSKHDPFKAFRMQLKSGEFAISQEEYDRANKEIDEYISNYKYYDKLVHEWENARLRTFKVDIEIVNTGSSVAEDVYASFHFPDGIRPWSIDTLPAKPKEPTEPAPPHSQMRIVKNYNLSQIQSLITNTRIAPTTASPFTIRKTNSYLVEDSYERIKHGFSVALQTLYVQFESAAAVQSFGIDYKLHPANLPEVITGRLDVIVKRAGSE